MFSRKPIENIKPGEEIISYDLKRKKQITATVEKIETHTSKTYNIITFEDNTKLEVTNEHPIYIKKTNFEFEGWGSIKPRETQWV